MRTLQEGGDLDLSLLPQEPEQAEQWPAPAATVFTDWILRLPCLPHVSKGIQVTLLQTFSRGNNFWKIHIPNIKKRCFFFLDKYSASLQSDYLNISLKARPVTIKKQKSWMETIPTSVGKVATEVFVSSCRFHQLNQKSPPVPRRGWGCWGSGGPHCSRDEDESVEAVPVLGTAIPAQTWGAQPLCSSCTYGFWKADGLSWVAFCDWHF